MGEKVERVKTKWKELDVDYFEDYSPGMLHYHMHDHYEISLILSGQMKILLENAVQTSAENCLVLTPAGAAHCIMHDPEVLYRRINVNFRESLLKGYIPEWRSLLDVFEKSGCVLLLNDSQSESLLELANEIRLEIDLFRRRLLLLLLLTQIARLKGTAADSAQTPPGYISEALAFIHTHYAKRIVAEALAARLGVSRTTLMTGFKKYIGTTLGEYVTRFRLQEAIRLLQKGVTQQEAAESCGLSDAGNLIRCFRRCYHTTPHKYLQEKQKTSA